MEEIMASSSRTAPDRHSRHDATTPAAENLAIVGEVVTSMEQALAYLQGFRDDLLAATWEEGYKAGTIVTLAGKPLNQTSWLYNILRARGYDTSNGRLRLRRSPVPIELPKSLEDLPAGTEQVGRIAVRFNKAHPDKYVQGFFSGKEGLTPSDRARIVLLHEDEKGGTMEEIARKASTAYGINVTPDGVRRVLEQAGVTPKRSGQRKVQVPVENVDALLERHETDNVPLRTLAREAGVSEFVLKRRFTEEKERRAQETDGT
ncbi:hypothetical protein ACFZAM_31585 [Streptomyces sp. NPDC008079]|uniref:hypothetical protein n=1 Tax=Streptomyces sp. NPDC008079 TaxID=3364806 RepID=UPI0036F0D748